METADDLYLFFFSVFLLCVNLIVIVRIVIRWFHIYLSGGESVEKAALHVGLGVVVFLLSLMGLIYILY